MVFPPNHPSIHPPRTIITVVVNCFDPVQQTVFMLLNYSNPSGTPIEIKIGNVSVTQEHQAKLLGMTINDKQKWSQQIREAGGLIPTLNNRSF